jgi:hypothetical protein
MGTCESCGRDDEALFAVHRMYVTPEAWDTPASSTTLSDVERWCLVCVTHYPHTEAEG